MSDKIKMISIGQLFSLAKQGYAQNFKALLGLAILPYVAALVGLLVVFLQKIGLGILDAGFIKTLYQVISSLLVVATYVFMFVISNLSAIAMILMIKSAPEKMTVKQSLTKAWPWFWSYIWVSILTTILLLLWGILLVIPAIIMAGYYSMAIWILFEGQHRGYAVIKQSKVLVRGYWWAIFWRQFVLVLLFLAIFGLLGYISWSFFGTESLVSMDQNKGSGVFDNLVNLVTSFLMPFYMIYFYNIYKNLVAIKNKSIANSQN